MSQRNSFCDITCVEKHKGFYNDADPECELNKILLSISETRLN